MFLVRTFNCFIGLGYRIARLYICKEVPPALSVLDMVLNCIWRQGPSSTTLRNVKHFFIAITLWYYACHATWLWLWFHDYHGRFQLIGLSMSFCAHIVFGKSADREWHNLSRTSFDGHVCSLGQVAWVMATQRYERLTVNN